MLLERDEDFQMGCRSSVRGLFSLAFIVGGSTKAQTRAPPPLFFFLKVKSKTKMVLESENGKKE